MFSSIGHKTKFWSFTRKRFCVVCALNCARILVVRALDCAQFLLHPALFPTQLEHCLGSMAIFGLFGQREGYLGHRDECCRVEPTYERLRWLLSEQDTRLVRLVTQHSDVCKHRHQVEQASKFVKIHGSKLLLPSLRAGSKTIFVVAIF